MQKKRQHKTSKKCPNWRNTGLKRRINVDFKKKIIETVTETTLHRRKFDSPPHVIS